MSTKLSYRLSIGFSALALGLFALAGPGAPASLEASDCGGYDGPKCGVTRTEICFNFLIYRWCSTFETTTYYPKQTEPGDTIHLENGYELVP